MTFPITKTADHTTAVGSLASTPVGGEHIFPTYLVTSDATAIGAANALYVQPGTGASWAITAASLPLPSGAATSAKQDSQTTHLATIAGAVSGTEVQVDVLTMPTVTVQDGSGSLTVDAPVGTPVYVRLSDGTAAISTLPVSLASAVAVTDNSGSLTVDDGGSSLTVDGTVSVSGTVAISAASLPLPSGASTAAKQPALGTAGTASSDVITVQGITGMTAVKVDGSAVTQPVSIAAAVAVTDNSGSLTVDGTVAATQSGTWTVGLSSGTNGIGKLTANSGVTIGAVEIASAQTLATVTTVTTVTTVSTLTGGGVAHDGVDSGNPVKIGGKAVSTQSGQTAVASGDRSDIIQDLDGTIIARNVPHGDLVTGNASTTGTSDTSVVSAQGASTYFYADCITAVNTGSTTALITFKDGSGGSTLWYAIVPAGGGVVIAKGGKPIFKTSANTALYFAAGSSSTTIYVSVSGYKSKV